MGQTAQLPQKVPHATSPFWIIASHSSEGTQIDLVGGRRCACSGAWIKVETSHGVHYEVRCEACAQYWGSICHTPARDAIRKLFTKINFKSRDKLLILARVFVEPGINIVTFEIISWEGPFRD